VACATCKTRRVRVAINAYIGLTIAQIYRIDIYLGYINRYTSRNEPAMRSRVESLEFALLGLLAQGPLHGYELRKRMVTIFGPFKAISFSVLYPQLRRMLLAGSIQEEAVDRQFNESGSASLIRNSKRPRIVYAITEEGMARFEALTESVSADAWEDEGFEIRFAFFSPTPTKSRVRILEGRLRRLQEKAEILRDEVEKSPIGIDKYLQEWRRHSLDSADREIAWLQEMITTERKSK
jgi:DNA-binding PadR family transcriptional regulator